MEIEKENLMEIRDSLQEMVSNINKLIPEGEPETEYPDWYVRRMGILVDILEAGGSVTKKEFHNIALRNGMDTRGVGGFFIKSNPSLTKFEDKDGSRVALTKKGKENAETRIRETATMID